MLGQWLTLKIIIMMKLVMLNSATHTLLVILIKLDEKNTSKVSINSLRHRLEL